MPTEISRTAYLQRLLHAIMMMAALAVAVPTLSGCIIRTEPGVRGRRGKARRGRRARRARHRHRHCHRRGRRGKRKCHSHPHRHPHH